MDLEKTCGCNCKVRHIGCGQPIPRDTERGAFRHAQSELSQDDFYLHTECELKAFPYAELKLHAVVEIDGMQHHNITDELEPIKARLAAISPAPWRAEPLQELPEDHGPSVWIWDATGDALAGEDGWHEWTAFSSADRDFIGHAPSDMRWLIAEVERLRVVPGR
jgi:hypothetical protein